MRVISEICEDYLLLLKKEGKINLTNKEISENSLNEADQVEIISYIEKELKGFEVYHGQKVSTPRAFYILCAVVVKRDLQTDAEVWNDMVKEFFLIVERHTKSMLNSRRGSGKTFWCALYSIFKMNLISHFQITAAFNIPLMIESFFDLFKEIIDNNEFLLRKKETNRRLLIWGTKNCIYNKGRVRGVTLGSTSKSKHVNLILIDDIYGKSEGKRYTNIDVERFVIGDLLPIIKRKKGRVLLVGTIDNEDDIYHTVAWDKDKKYKRSVLLCIRPTLYISAKGWACRIYPAVLNFDKKEVLLPSIFSWEEVMMDKEEMGDYLWYREMQCLIKIDKSALISYHLFMKCCNKDESLQEVGDKDEKYVMTVDPSAGEGVYSDYAAISVIQKKDGKKIIRYLWEERLVPIIDPSGGDLDLTHKVIDVFRNFNKPELWIENNSIGRILIQNLRKEGLETYEHSTKEDKVKIMMDSISDFKRDNLVIIPNNPECEFTQQWVTILKKECLNYGLSKKGETGKLIIGARGGFDDLITAVLLGLHYSSDESAGLAMGICQN